MGYERNDYGARGQSYGDNRQAQRGQSDRYNSDQDSRDDRGFFDRAGDEVRSWFGDEEAEHRRERDDRGRRGAEPGYPMGSSQPGRAQQASPQDGRNQGFDPHYHSWREQQIAALDRDYHEFRQHSQTTFENEFGGWRTQRQSQRQLLDQVEEHAEVVGSDGAHVGKVDKVRGDRIILAKNDPDADGRHHSIPSLWLQAVEGHRIVISKSADEAKRAWRDEERGGAFFVNEDRGQQDRQHQGDGPHVLNRSFSGTY